MCCEHVTLNLKILPFILYIDRFRFGMPRVPIGSKLDEGSLKKVTDANRIYDVPQISEI